MRPDLDPDRPEKAGRPPSSTVARIVPATMDFSINSGIPLEPGFAIGSEQSTRLWLWRHRDRMLWLADGRLPSDGSERHPLLPRGFAWRYGKIDAHAVTVPRARVMHSYAGNVLDSMPFPNRVSDVDERTARPPLTSAPTSSQSSECWQQRKSIFPIFLLRTPTISHRRTDVLASAGAAQKMESAV